MSGGVELIYDYFEDRARAAAVVRQQRPVALGALGFLVGGLSLFIAQGLTQQLHLLGFSCVSCALVALWNVAAGFLLAAVVHAFVDMGGKAAGGVAALFVFFGLADLAWALAVPLALIARVFSPASWIMTGGYLAIGLLTLSLKARGVQDNYDMAPGRAWLTLSLPYFAAAALAFIAVSLAVVGLVMQLIHALA